MKIFSNKKTKNYILIKIIIIKLKLNKFLLQIKRLISKFIK